jgi:hypothetical protein
VGESVKGDFGSGPFFDLYNSSKIILNDCIDDDLNWRVFEGLASGALLLTPRVSAETLDLFPEGECLITYTPHDADDAIRKIRYYLDHEDERIAIASRGYKRVRAEHLASNRATQLVEVIERATSRPVADKLFSAAMTYLRIAAIFSLFYKERYLSASQSAIGALMKVSDVDRQWLDEKVPFLKAAVEEVSC